LRNGFEPVATFAFDHIAHEINLKGRYEVAELSSTVNFLNQHSLVSGCAIDVGANIGNHALFFSRFYEKVIALEPNPRVFELLSLNSRLMNNVLPLKVAASDRAGEMRLSFAPGNWGGGHLLPVSEQNSEAVTVGARLLDDLPEISSLHVGLMKIDVEGHEEAVVKEMLKCSFAGQIREMFYEVDLRWVNPQVLQAMLHEAGFQTAKIGRKKHYDVLATRASPQVAPV
jgi:FkbM family methyltransferase